MKNIIAAVKSAPKKAAILSLAAIGVIASPFALNAWGPDRVTFTYEKPADYVTFNSMTNNPTHGDERNFVRIKNVAGGTYGESTDVQPGAEYEVSVFYHNNASSSLNESGAGIAHNTQMKVVMPEVVKAGENAKVSAIISADNAVVKSTDGRNMGNKVWDEAFLNNKGSDTVLRYVPGSATVSSVHKDGSVAPVNGAKLPDSLYTTGALLGYNALDGNLPGCNQYSGYVTFRIKAVQPNFDVQKTVSLNEQNKYAEEVTVKENDTVQYKIAFNNTGSTQLDNVVIKDKLPAGVTYVPGTTFISNSKTNGQWSAVKEDTVTTTGINIGSYAPGGNAFVKFTAKVSPETCGLNTMVNTAVASTPNGDKSDTAKVIVNKDCKEIQVCDMTTGVIVNIAEKDFDSKKHSKNLADCEKIKVCIVKEDKIVDIKKSEFNKEVHSTNMSDCQKTPATPTTPAELPATGAKSDILSLIGAGSLVAASLYYIASRKNA